MGKSECHNGEGVELLLRVGRGDVQAFELVGFHGHSITEAARLAECSERILRQRLYEARKRLRAALGQLVP